METLGKVSSAIGHEASNILGALGTCLQILRKNPQLTPDDVELLDIVQSGSRRLHEMVSEFALFRPAAPHLQAVGLKELINETIALLARDARYTSSIVIECQFSSSVGKVEGDSDQLRGALWNLCINALEAMGGHGRLEIEVNRTGGAVRVAVRDSGPGIAVAQRAHVFEPFHTTKPGRAGLGLSYARYVVENHGGHISVESSLGTGACFVLYLPAATEGESIGYGSSKRSSRSKRS